jgi:protein FAM32A
MIQRMMRGIQPRRLWGREHVCIAALTKYTLRATMANDDYAFAGSGALKLKGGKVKKHKKKKDKRSLETALSTGASTPGKQRRSATPGEDENLKALDRGKHQEDADAINAPPERAEEEDEDIPKVKTAAELKFEEARRRKVCRLPFVVSRYRCRY